MFGEYDIIVVGAGHAGCEAACAAANLGSKTLLISMNMDYIAQMSCNPAIGGVAKGQIAREIDALGGYTGIVADKSMIQFRMLNRSKGPAMWSPRSQNDRMLFSTEWLRIIENTNNLDYISDNVKEVIIENNKAVGVKTIIGKTIKAKSIILCNGTFLNGKIYIGKVSFEGGRIGESSSKGLTSQLASIGFTTDRLKTGTPVRVDGRTIDYSVLIEQPGDENPGKFSYTNTPTLTKQKSCYLGYTSEEVHDILRTGFKDSPLFNKEIHGVGPRYCPSIEDKLNKFADKDKHQLFVEPEGWNTHEVYLNGFSSSLPEEIQYKAIHKIKGFEKAKFIKPGYAIEYDYFDPTQLNRTLETKLIENLYFAGQINGTTGYEEAAAQGIMAGINAHLKNNDMPPFELSRSDAYIGVLIDDLITKGVDEPYRMFTSRAEHRILLRQDNADIRLTPRSYNIGLASKERYLRVREKEEKTNNLLNFLETTNVTPNEVNNLLEQKNTGLLNESVKLAKLLLRPQVSLNEIKKLSNKLDNFLTQNNINEEVIEQAEINLKYGGYILKETALAKKMNSLFEIKLNKDIDYMKLKSLSYECREKLNKIKPTSIGQAANIPGVSPADIAALIVVLGVN